MTLKVGGYMTDEYLVCYTLNGKGFSDTEPWIDCKTEDIQEALESYNDLVDYLKEFYPVHEAWMESREVGTWIRVDPTILG